MGGGETGEVKHQRFQHRISSGKFFPLPNALFRLELCPGEIAVYAFLMYREDRKTYQCYPSYKTIGKAIRMSTNTVRKYVSSLEEKKLISTEPTTVVTGNGEKRNGTLRYTIRPVQDAIDYLQERERKRAEQELVKVKVSKLHAAKS